jgi:hypothetical protein
MKIPRLPFAAVALTTPRDLINTTNPESLLKAKLLTGARS